jgi:hypothetical protein
MILKLSNLLSDIFYYLNLINKIDVFWNCDFIWASLVYILLNNKDFEFKFFFKIDLQNN